jgi:hypothetical protein
VDKVNDVDENPILPKTRYTKCVNYMKNTLDKGYPICVGVNHKPNTTYNNDKTTDHWICVYAYATDGKKIYFKFYESGSSKVGICTSDNNILIYEPNYKTPLFYCENAYKNKRYDVTQIRICLDQELSFVIGNATGPHQDPTKIEGNTKYAYQPNKKLI